MMFRAIRTLTAVAARPVFTKAPIRGFAQTPLAKADVIENLYLNELRSFKPTAGADKVDLPQTFAPPTPPPKPELEQAVAQAADATDAVAETEAADWPPLYDPIDDPENYPDEWNMETADDRGEWYPIRTKPPHYDDH
ncbi:hypothetical protein HDV00_002899 [Rhizophlyctis rosea]|nr:hypothetical protein HDV00_002899 [Rhizophlyctis rosea]